MPFFPTIPAFSSTGLISPPTLPNGGGAFPIPYSSSARLRSIGAVASVTALLVVVSRELQRVCGTGGRVEEKEDWCERVGFLACRGRLLSEEEVREGLGSVLMALLLFQSGRSSGCYFHHPSTTVLQEGKIREGGKGTYLQLIQSIESVIAVRDPRINLHMWGRIVRITHRPQD